MIKIKRIMIPIIYFFLVFDFFGFTGLLFEGLLTVGFCCVGKEVEGWLAALDDEEAEVGGTPVSGEAALIIKSLLLKHILRLSNRSSTDG